MALLTTWDASLSVGNREIDEQHQALLELGRRIYWLAVIADHPSTRQEFHGVLRELVNLARRHYETEEAALSRNGFPDLAAHQAAHQHYLGMLKRLLFKSINNELDAGAVAELVTGYIRHHLMDTDLPCKGFMIEPDA